MSESVGNYSIPTQNGNVEGADMLAGAAILNILNICIQQIPVNAPNCSLDNIGVEFPHFYINDFFPNCQFAGLTYTGQCYWYHVLKETNFKIALTLHLLSWKAGLKQVNIQNLTICVTSNKICLYQFKYRLW